MHHPDTTNCHQDIVLRIESFSTTARQMECKPWRDNCLSKFHPNINLLFSSGGLAKKNGAVLQVVLNVKANEPLHWKANKLKNQKLMVCMIWRCESRWTVLCSLSRFITNLSTVGWWWEFMGFGSIPWDILMILLHQETNETTFIENCTPGALRSQ